MATNRRNRRAASPPATILSDAVLTGPLPTPPLADPPVGSQPPASGGASGAGPVACADGPPTGAFTSAGTAPGPDAAHRSRRPAPPGADPLPAGSEADRSETWGDADTVADSEFIEAVPPHW
ncbi:MAG: hypothetical protein LBC97_07180 [Bifidobacteriaceae bacterium]|nr:hypothetical protein [Bifidobacteriaceae bacterium]